MRIIYCTDHICLRRHCMNIRTRNPCTDNCLKISMFCLIKVKCIVVRKHDSFWLPNIPVIGFAFLNNSVSCWWVFSDATPEPELELAAYSTLSLFSRRAEFKPKPRPLTSPQQHRLTTKMDNKNFHKYISKISKTFLVLKSFFFTYSSKN